MGNRFIIFASKLILKKKFMPKTINKMQIILILFFIVHTNKMQNKKKVLLSYLFLLRSILLALIQKQQKKTDEKIHDYDGGMYENEGVLFNFNVKNVHFELFWKLIKKKNVQRIRY
jgi:preprotein translocase subunit SecG